jgi:hypothetical protein
MTTEEKAEQVSIRIDELLSEIASMFKPGRKLTLLVRSPEMNDGSGDLVRTNDSLYEAVAALLRRKYEPFSVPPQIADANERALEVQLALERFKEARAIMTNMRVALSTQIVEATDALAERGMPM